MPEEIHRELEDVPQDIKTLFRTVQTAEETENGDPIALYNSDNDAEVEARWIRLGRYKAAEQSVETEYFINYDTSTQKLGARLYFTSRDIHSTDKTVKYQKKYTDRPQKASTQYSTKKEASNQLIVILPSSGWN